MQSSLLLGSSVTSLVFQGEVIFLPVLWQAGCLSLCTCAWMMSFSPWVGKVGGRFWDIMAESRERLCLWQLLPCPFQDECYKMSFNGLSSCKLSLGQVALAFLYSSIGWTIMHQKVFCRAVVGRAVQHGQSVSPVHSPRNACVREATKGTCLKRQMSEKSNALGV